MWLVGLQRHRVSHVSSLMRGRLLRPSIRTLRGVRLLIWEVCNVQRAGFCSARVGLQQSG